MKIVFMGTPEIAVPSLKCLIDSSHEVAAVITQPDQKSGRGMSVKFSPVKETALQHKIPCYQPEHIGDPEFMDFLESIGADVFAVAAYAQKIPDRILTMPRFGCINMHPSLLPKYRGSGPLRGPILNGDLESGVTIMQLTSQWDAGDILIQEHFLLDPKETSETLQEKCSVLGAKLMLEAIDGLEAGTITPTAQDASKATYLKQIKKEEGIIDFQESAVQIERQIRACIPWPSAFTTLHGKTFKIWEADAVESLPGSSDKAVQTGAKREPGMPEMTGGGLPDAAAGTIVHLDKKGFYIQTGCGYLKPVTVQIEGKKRMSAQDFMRGYKLETGVTFGSSGNQK